MIGYYVTMRRGERQPRVAFLAGPYATHEEALRAVPSARALANRMDQWSEFDAFGTAALEPAARLGVFNHLVRNDRSVTTR